MKPLFFGFAPNMNKETLRLSLASLYPWQRKNWYKAEPVLQVESLLSAYFDQSAVYAVDSGRSALYLALKARGIGKGDDVLVCGYTCIVVADAVVATGATPIYVDIDDTLCMDPNMLESKITARSKAIILQHTFGYPGQLDRLLEISRKANLFIIEDCAHSLGSTYKNKKLGTFGDCAIISFGVEKIISSVRGGAIVTKNKDVARALGELCNQLPQFPKNMLGKHLLYYPIMSMTRALFKYKIGGYLLLLSRTIGLLPQIVFNEERQGKMSGWTPCKYPGALARLVLPDLKKLDKIIAERKKIADELDLHLNTICVQSRTNEVAPLFVSVAVDDPHLRAQELRKNGVIISLDWSLSPIIPSDARRDLVSYQEGSCPVAEERAKHLLVFPTHLSIKYTPNHINKILDIL